MQLPDRPNLEHLRKQAKARRRDGVTLGQAQHEFAHEYGFASWPRLVQHVRALDLEGIERYLTLADPVTLAAAVASDPALATEPVDSLPPLLYLLRRSGGTGADVRACARVLLEAGADANASTQEREQWGEWDFYAIRSAVDRDDVALIELLIAFGAERDDDAMYHACARSSVAMLDALYKPGAEEVVNHKLDFEDEAGLRWFLARGVDVNKHCCLHFAIARGRSVRILELILAAGADHDQPWTFWDIGRRPLALAARCGHLAAFELLERRGATAELDPVDRAVLAVAQGESVELPRAKPPALGNPEGRDYGWIVGQFALLDRVEIVRALLDAGRHVDTRGWSNFTPVEQAAMHGRRQTVELLIERGADLTDQAWGDHGPNPLDCAIWGLRNNRAHDGDYVGTVKALVAAGALTTHEPPSDDPAVDAVLKEAGIW